MFMKFERLDVMRLFTDWDDKEFKRFVLKMINKRNIGEMFKARYGLQSGMAFIADKQICHEEHVLKFVRWQKILEMGIRVLYRRLHPNPLDNPANRNNPALDFKKADIAKKQRDRDLELLFRKYNY